MPRRLGYQGSLHLYIPLAYGAKVDWCVNVLAAGGCTVDHKGERFKARAPAIVPYAVAAPLLSGRLQRTLGLYRVTSFLRLDVSADKPCSAQAQG